MTTEQIAERLSPYEASLTKLKPSASKAFFEAMGASAETEIPSAQKYYQGLNLVDLEKREAKDLKTALETGDAETIRKAHMDAIAALGQEETEFSKLLDAENQIAKSLLELGNKLLAPIAEIARYMKSVKEVLDEYFPTAGETAQQHYGEKAVEAARQIVDPTGAGSTAVSGIKRLWNRLFPSKGGSGDGSETDQLTAAQQSLSDAESTLKQLHADEPAPGPEGYVLNDKTLTGAEREQAILKARQQKATAEMKIKAWSTPGAYSQKAQLLEEQKGLPPGLVEGIMQVESSGKPTARSPAGAMGLMQLMPGTADRFHVKDPWDPDQNLQGGAAYLDWLYNVKYKNDPDRLNKTIQAYHDGEKNVDAGIIGPEGRAYGPKVRAAMAHALARRARAAKVLPPSATADRPPSKPIELPHTQDEMGDLVKRTPPLSSAHPAPSAEGPRAVSSAREAMNKAKAARDALKAKLMSETLSKDERHAVFEEFNKQDDLYRKAMQGVIDSGEYTPVDAPGMPKPPAPKNEKTNVGGTLDVNVTIKDKQGNVKGKGQGKHKMGSSTQRSSGGTNSVEAMEADP